MPSIARVCLVLIVAGALLVGTTSTFFPPGVNMRDPSNVRFIISYNSLVFIIVGLAGTFLICINWASAGLLAGACLLVGGFFGLLFGYPQGVAQNRTAPSSGQRGAQTPSQEKNLIAESAATLGKVLTGFTLAKLDTISGHFWSLCYALGLALGGDARATNQVIAGIVLTYFLATGFLSGLLLPSYFMSDFLNNSFGQNGNDNR